MTQTAFLDDREKESEPPRDVDIPNELPQFDPTPALFMVANEKEMSLYRAERGRMAEIASRDIEGMRTPAELKSEVRMLLKGIVRPRDYDTFYIFAEPAQKRSIMKALPTAFAKKVTSVVEEYTTTDDPLALIKKLVALR